MKLYGLALHVCDDGFPKWECKTAIERVRFLYPPIKLGPWQLHRGRLSLLKGEGGWGFISDHLQLASS